MKINPIKIHELTDIDNETLETYKLSNLYNKGKLDEYYENLKISFKNNEMTFDYSNIPTYSQNIKEFIFKVKLNYNESILFKKYIINCKGTININKIYSLKITRYYDGLLIYLKKDYNQRMIIFGEKEYKNLVEYLNEKI